MSSAPEPAGQTDGVTRPLPDDAGLWPSIRQERIRTLLGPAMERAGVDAWVVLARENANDPIAPHVGAENAGGLAAFLFFHTGGGALSYLALSPETEATALAEVTPHGFRAGITSIANRDGSAALAWTTTEPIDERSRITRRSELVVDPVSRAFTQTVTSTRVPLEGTKSETFTGTCDVEPVRRDLRAVNTIGPDVR